MAICEKCKSSMVIIKSNTGAKHCMNCGWCSDDNSYKKMQTNAERIRSMSDEELAELLEEIETVGSQGGCFTGDVSFLAWLKSEVEG